MAVDFDRGVNIRLHKSGIRVCMYLDDPGAFYDANGDPLADSYAAQAGFDVEGLTRERKKREALAKAQAEIERDFAKRDADYERVAEAAVMGSLTVRHISRGKYAVFSEAGEQVTQGSFTKEQAEKLLATVSGGDSDGGET